MDELGTTGGQLTAREIEAHPAMKESWYYAVDLAPGLRTPGTPRKNVALTRRLLANAEIEPGLRCLDIGTMEGLVPVLLTQRGATVTAYDRLLRTLQLDLVQQALGTSFDLVGVPFTSRRGNETEDIRVRSEAEGMPLHNLRGALAERGEKGFDVVVLSGVLYHVYDPVAVLAIARGLARDGGLVFVETAAFFDAQNVMQLNSGEGFGPNAIWHPSTGVLDRLLRLVRLEPLETLHVGVGRGRVAVACRAVDHVPSDDTWLNNSMHEKELREWLDWSETASTEAPVAYRPQVPMKRDLATEIFEQVPSQPEPDEQILAWGASV